jgi:hypothetical protein
MKKWSVIAKLAVPVLLMAANAYAGAGGAPWDPQ